jgi:hypothetical protein
MSCEPLADWELELLAEQAARQEADEKQRAARLRRLGPMPPMYEPLAAYNAECKRGLMHTAEYDAAMAWLQREFNEWAGLS